MPEVDGYGNEVHRGHNGGYLLNGREYNRTTSVVGAIDDKSAIADWKVRMALKGFEENPNLKKEYDMTEMPRAKNRIIGKAVEASGAYDRRELGTEVHWQLERADLGKPGCPEVLQERWLAALDQAGLRVARDPEPMVERVLFNLQLDTGGMTDRVFITSRPLTLMNQAVVPANSLLIGDIKTGKYAPTSQYSGSMFRQLCVYATADLMLNQDGEPVDITALNINSDFAVVAHVDPEEWTVKLYLCDLRGTMSEIEAVAAVQRARAAPRYCEALN